MSLAVGLNSALTTLVSQARGCKDVTTYTAGARGRDDVLVDEPIVFLYRGVFVQLCCVMPVGFYWIWGVKGFLLSLGQGELLSSMTEDYLRILAPGLWGYCLNWCIISYLQSLELADIPALAATVGLFLHVPFNRFFITTLNFGYLGAATATVCFQTIQPLIQIWYLWYTRLGQERLRTSRGDTTSHTTAIRTAVSSATGLRRYLSLALPGLLVISEWWASEAAIFFSGWISPVALAGMSIYQSLNSFCFLFPYGAGAGGTTRIGTLLGRGDAVGAALACKVALAHGMFWSGLWGILLWCIPHEYFPRLFTPDDDVVTTAAMTVPLLGIYVMVDGLTCTLNGVVKGCGRQCITVPIVIVSYWALGLPVGYYLAFVRQAGVVGLVTGMTLGTSLHCLLMNIAVGVTDWKKEGRKAKERLNVENDEEQRLLDGDPTLASPVRSIPLSPVWTR